MNLILTIALLELEEYIKYILLHIKYMWYNLYAKYMQILILTDLSIRKLTAL